jgi:hypothetical protein
VNTKKLKLKGNLKSSNCFVDIFTDNVECEDVLDLIELSEMASEYELFYLWEYCIKKCVGLISKENVHQILEASISKSRFVHLHAIKFFKNHEIDAVKTKNTF